MVKRLGTIQVDVDGLWTIQSFLAQFKEAQEDVIFECGIPIFLELFKKFNIKATFFVNAKDLNISWKKDLIVKIAKNGHEIANHGYSHRYFSQISFAEKKVEIEKSTTLLSQVTKERIVGFRAPGYDIDKQIFDLLEKFGYLYDSSIWPSYLSPFLKLWQRFIISKRSTGYNYSLSLMFSPIKPYFPSEKNFYWPGSRNILEIPVTTLPFLRMPFHFSYLFLGKKQYFNFGLWLLKRRCKYLNFIFHLIDLVGSDRLKDTHFLFSPKMLTETKLKIAEYVLSKIQKEYTLLPTRELCAIYKGSLKGH